MTANLIKTLYFIITAFVSINIFIIPNMWDGLSFSHAFKINDLEYLNIHFKENSTHFLFVPFYLIFFLKNIFQINHEILFDVFTVISYILFCYEIGKLNKYLFNFNNIVVAIGSLLAASIPLWESLVAIIHAMYIFCFYLALVGHRLFLNKDYRLKVLGIILMLFSFSIKSSFALVFGLSLAYNLKRGLIDKNLNFTFPFIFFLCIFSYFVDTKFFPRSGYFNDYNIPQLSNLRPELLFSNIANYLTFFIPFLWLPFLSIIFEKNEKRKEYFKKDFIIKILCILVILSSVMLPYLLVNRTTDIFYFREWAARHAYLIVIPFSLFFSLFFEKSKLIFKNNIYYVLLFIFFIESTFILSAKFYFKIEAFLFRENFVENLKKFDTPPSGFLVFRKENGDKFSIIDTQVYLPGHRFRNHEVGPYFYDAYKKEAWLLFTPGAKDGKYLDFDKYRKFYQARDFDLKSTCKIEIQFDKSLNFYERIKRFYIFNSKKYFSIKSITSVC